jgi:hypothetical protein
MIDDALLEPGAVVGGFRVVRKIGAGGMGAVFEAEEVTIGRRVALKVLLPKLAVDASFSERFLREAKALGRVRHPTVIDVFTFGSLPDGRPYFVMPLLEGSSLREELATRGRLPGEEAWRLVREIVSGLGAAHAAGVLHRDLKPENVFIAEWEAERRPMLLDFGVAKWTPDPSSPDDAPPAQLTATGAPIGTPAYMAPEQWWGQPAEPATDQYALGVMLHELLSGSLPFAATALPDLLARHLHDPPPSLASKGVEAPVEVEAFLARLMAKAPGDRYPDMSGALRAGDAAFGLAPTTRATGAPTPSALEREAAVRVSDALAPTELVSSAATGGRRSSLEGARSAAPPSSGRVVAMATACITLGTFWLHGYAAPERHDVSTWLQMAGFGTFLTLPVFVVGGVVLLALGRRSAESGWAFGAALLPALAVAISTYTGWLNVSAAVDGAEPGTGFALLHLGRYENGCGDFLGHGLASALLLAAFTFGLRPQRPRPVTEALASGAVLGFLALGSAIAGLSASFLLGVAAVVCLTAPLTETLTPSLVGRGLGAVLAARGAATARVDAHAASAWFGDTTRAERVRAIVEADLDTRLTGIAAWVAPALVVAALGAIWWRRRATSPRVTARWLLEPALIAACLGPQLGLEIAFRQRRAGLETALRDQFALFATLSPPTTRDPALPQPALAPAMQVSRDRVALDGREVGRLKALDNPRGRRSVEDAVVAHLARPPISPFGDRPVDLSCTFDRSLPWPQVEDLLGIAYDGGARQVDLLLVRGSDIDLPKGAPNEATLLVPSDFGALSVELVAGGPPLEAATYAEAIANLADTPPPRKLSLTVR